MTRFEGKLCKWASHLKYWCPMWVISRCSVCRGTSFSNLLKNSFFVLSNLSPHPSLLLFYLTVSEAPWQAGWNIQTIYEHRAPLLKSPLCALFEYFTYQEWGLRASYGEWANQKLRQRSVILDCFISVGPWFVLILDLDINVSFLSFLPGILFVNKDVLILYHPKQSKQDKTWLLTI